MTDEDKILKDVKKAVEEGRSLDRFGAYLKTFSTRHPRERRIVIQ